ncbi:MAG: adenylyltransferase/cytidyltransferase family protein [Candidatus Aenigmarchaeota archaeon]|nr:adenylyltransferase/cytidyltransferase family protein [Candidatus Aenigmarchaeota archaeon]
MKKITGVYWGRFNPSHKGHLKLIKKILGEVDKLIIAIGAAEIKNTKRNPFNGKEKKKMMEAYFKESGIYNKKITVIAIPDGKSFSSAVKNLFELCGKFDVLYTDKETIIKMVEKRVKVRRIHRTGSISSTKIRDAIANNRKWEHLTGRSVATLIKKFNGVQRIKKAYLITR